MLHSSRGLAAFAAGCRKQLGSKLVPLQVKDSRSWQQEDRRQQRQQ
jgi:hypothetical protein